MLTLFGRFLREFLWDEEGFKRHASTLLFALGLVLLNGGNIPGYETTFPGLKAYAWVGFPMLMLGYYISTGKTPGGAALSDLAKATIERVTGKTNGGTPPAALLIFVPPALLLAAAWLWT